MLDPTWVGGAGAGDISGCTLAHDWVEVIGAQAGHMSGYKLAPDWT